MQKNILIDYYHEMAQKNSFSVNNNGIFKITDLPFKVSESNKMLIEYHYYKHHQGYINSLNAKLKDDSRSIFEIGFHNEKSLTHLPKDKETFFAAQIWNHDLFWNTIDLSDDPLNKVSEKVLKMFNCKSEVELCELFTETAMSHIGSGWIFITFENDKINFINTDNADMPSSHYALGVIDIWEHAFYPQFANDKASYIKFIWRRIKWDFIESNINLIKNHK